MKSIKNLYTWIHFQFKKRTPRIKKQIQKTEKEYKMLIHESHKIQDKSSLLTRAERDQVEARVLHLIGKGHINIE